MFDIQTISIARAGKLDKAIALGEEALALDRKVGSIAYTPGTLTSLGSNYQILGEWSKSEQFYNDAAVASEKVTDSLPKVAMPFYYGWLHFDKEEYTRAKESFEEAYKATERLGHRELQMQSNSFLILACIELGETGKAENLLDSLRKYALETEGTWHKLNEMALRAMLLRAQKMWDESLDLFEKTLREWESIKADIWFAYFFTKWVLCEYARAHLERNEEGDKEKARHLLNRALGMFQKMGAGKDIERVEARIAFIETGKAVSKPKLVPPVSTGHTDLDRLLYGGIPPNYAVVLTSPSCDERDLLVNSFLGTGAKKGEVTFHVTINASLAKALAEKFESNLQLFICNPEAEAIIKSSPNVHTLKGVENLTDISIALTSAIRNLDASLKGPRRICLGLVSDVLLRHHAVETRRWLTALMTKLKSEDFTTLAVIDPKMHASEELHAILGLFDGEISIYEKETDKASGKYLKIKKMSNQKYLEDELPLRKEGVG
jgi:KaiC/GvpD/RAD55 family RecA-like ATPase